MNLHMSEEEVEKIKKALDLVFRNYRTTNTEKMKNKSNCGNQDQSNLVGKAVFSRSCDFMIVFVVFCLWRVSPMVMWEAALRRRGETG